MSRSMTLIRILKRWIPLALAITFMSIVLYATAQHILRTDGNDPQIQMSEDAARALASGQPAQSVVASQPIDIALSNAPFVVVYDQAGKPVASSGLFHGQMPVMPAGVFDYVRQHGEERVTWQPESGVRLASVVTRVDAANASFVMAGRSLALVEQRIGEVELMIVAGWAGTLFTLLIAVAILEWLFPG